MGLNAPLNSSSFFCNSQDYAHTIIIKAIQNINYGEKISIVGKT